LRTVLFCLALWVIGWVLTQPFRAVEHGPGVLAPAEPAQGPLLERAPVIRVEGWNLTPLATYAIHARVLSTKSYRSDATAAIAPLDLLLGWGPMSDTAVIKDMRFSQSNRFGYWEHDTASRISPADISRHAANTHLIPANRYVRDRLTSLKVGSVVRLRGKLIEATPKDGNGSPWRSSLSRTDTGDGACEIIYVESVVGM
jgi:hypothetical protein